MNKCLTHFSIPYTLLWIAMVDVLLQPSSVALGQSGELAKPKKDNGSKKIDSRNKDRSKNNTPPPHPWMALIPGELTALVEKGNVSISVDDLLLEQVKKRGVTRFRFQVQYRYRLESPPASNGYPEFHYSFQNLEYQFQHQIIINSHFAPAQPWNDPLLRHELDHVSISLDPRVEKILDCYFRDKHSLKIENVGDGATTTTELRGTPSQIDDMIRKQSQSFISQVEELVQFYYDRLDYLSDQGNKSLEERAIFLSSLYATAPSELVETYSFIHDRNWKPQLPYFGSYSSEEWGKSTFVPKIRIERHYRDRFLP